MRDRAAAWLTWLVSGVSFAFATCALWLVYLNGGDIGATDTTGSSVLAISFSLVGAVIVATRPENPIGWALLVGGFFNSLNAFSAEYPRYALVTDRDRWPGGPFVAWLSTWVFAPGFATLPLTLLLFPTGRPPSRRWRWLLWLIAVAVMLMVLPTAVAAWQLKATAATTINLWPAEIAGDRAGMLQNIGIALGLLGMLAAVVSIALRFRQSTPLERQQLKWLVYAGVLALVVLLTASPASPLDLPGVVGTLLSDLAVLALPSIPAAIGIAILRYRLYDIDLVINRTLVYGALTATLAIIYFGGVVVLQALLRRLTGQESSLAVVASTLAIAALFGPFRRRIQGFIDRRFYRRKYDAARTLAGFSATLRDEVDLDNLTRDLIGVVQETVQPAHVSLWLVPAHRDPYRSAQERRSRDPASGRQGV